MSNFTGRAIFPPALGDVGKAILSEIYEYQWDVPTVRNVGQFDFELAYGTHVGSKRARNEDRLAFARISTLENNSYAVAIVCDGVGGSESGDIAASIAIASVVEALSTMKSPNISALLDRALRRCDEAVRSALSGSGTTTLSVLLISANGDVIAASVGDSRVFSWSQSRPALMQVSMDDTIENELRLLKVDNAALLDARGLRGRLSQAIGEVDRTAADLQVQIITSDLFPESAVLATDGAWKGSEDGFAAIWRNVQSAGDGVRRTINFSLWCGGVDNVTVMAVKDIPALVEWLKTPQYPVGAYVTVWFGDSKVVLRHSKNIPPMNRTDVEASGETKRKRPRKPSGRKREKGEDADGAQMSFPSESTSQSESKPKVVISTDDPAKD